MIGIYKITNPIGQVYIGQSKDIKKRFTYYTNKSCRKQPKLYNSILTYGIENHLFEVVEECTLNELNNRERYYQDFYNVLENGLNLILQSNDEQLLNSKNIKRYIVNVKFEVFWQFKNATHFKVTKCKKIINCKNNTIVKQSVRGGSCGYWINNQFIKRKDLNSFLELIPKKEFLPF